MSNHSREPPDDQHNDRESSDPPTDRASYSRRSVLKTIGVGAGLTAFGTSAATLASSAEDYWTFVVLPDTQFYAETDELAPYVREQTQWIVDNRDSEQIRFVSHEGDLVQNAENTSEWDRIDGAMSTLDGAVPYSTLPGNHDWEVWFDKDSSIQNYRDYFGPSRFEGRPWFGGSSPNGLNTYQTFSGGGYEFLHLALEFEPSGSIDDPDTPLGWAQSVLDDNPTRPTILTTHSYLNDRGNRVDYVQDDDDDGNSGETVWNQLVAPNSQIFMVLNGHWTIDDGEAHQVSTNDEGLPVYEVMADFQDRQNGGNGWLRFIQFVSGGGSGDDDRIQIKTYSPHFDEYERDDDSEFAFDVQFSERFASDTGTTTKGDVDGDGDVDADDVKLIQRDVASQDVDIDSEAADVDGDGDVDIGDVIATRNKAEGR